MKRHEFVGRNLLAEMCRRGITVPEMASRLQISTSTFYRRVRSPEQFTIQNLDDAAAMMKIPLEELLKKGA